MVWLADEAPWIATEILADDERIAGNELRVRDNVKTRPKRRLENRHPGWVVSVLGFDIAIDPRVIFATMLYNRLFIIRSSLRESYGVVERQLDRFLCLQKIV